VPIAANNAEYVVLETAAPLHLKNPVGVVFIEKKQTCPTKNGSASGETRSTPVGVNETTPRLIPVVLLSCTAPRLIPFVPLIVTAICLSKFNTG
jgi:hypothetical protein